LIVQAEAIVEREQYQQLAIGAAILAIIAAIATGRLPRWLRVTLVVGLVALAAGAALYAYRYATGPTTLSVAAGSVDGDAPRFMTAIASRMAAANSPVRLKVIEKPTALEAGNAFSAGDVDLAVTRVDIGDLSGAQTVVVFGRGVVLIIAPPGSSLTSIDDLKGKTVGVVGGQINHKIVDVLNKEYDLDRAKVQFKDLVLTDVQHAIKSRQVNALLIVMPITEKYLGLLRNLFPRNAKSGPTLIPIESAEAIASVTKYYESYDLPKGTLQGSPAIPDDDLTTLRVPFYLVAKKKLSDDVVGSLTKAIMDARRDLIGEYPVLAQISEPDTDKDSGVDTFIPIHPGASAYFDGTQKTFLDKYGDQFFYGSMLLGTLSSIFAAVWKYLMKNERGTENLPLMRLYALKDSVAKATCESELAETEQRIDEIFRGELEKHARGGRDAVDTGALGLTMQQLANSIAQRRAAFSKNDAVALKQQA